MGMNTPGRRGALSEINVTPLVDVMLVLLVVFMVTTPIIVEEMQNRSEDVDLPITNSKPVPASELQTILKLTKGYGVFLDTGRGQASEIVTCAQPTPAERGACLDRVEANLKANVAIQEKISNGDRLYFMADRSLPYGFVVDVMSRVRAAGIGNMGLVTNPPEKPEGPG